MICMKKGIVKAFEGERVTFRKYYAGIKQRRAVMEYLSRQPGVTSLQIRPELEALAIRPDGTTRRRTIKNTE